MASSNQSHVGYDIFIGGQAHLSRRVLAFTELGYGIAYLNVGFTWCLESQLGPTIGTNSVINSVYSFGDDFNGTITGLKPHTAYRIEAYAEIGNTVGYGNALVVTTP